MGWALGIKFLQMIGNDLYSFWVLRKSPQRGFSVPHKRATTLDFKVRLLAELI